MIPTSPASSTATNKTLAERRLGDASSRPMDRPFAAGSKVDAQAHPVQVEGDLLPGASSWLWLFRWVLVIPHAICLALLWTAFAVLTAPAFVAVLLTGRYPRRMFDFNVGVLRWTWRVTFYGPTYATDRYPPFTLADVPDYPARLHIEYRLRQRKGVALMGWWLTGIPRYLLAIAVAIGSAFGWPWEPDWNAVLAANRWVISVAACAALLTDEYPPLRLEDGTHVNWRPDDLYGAPAFATRHQLQS
jgi:uncharacterized protein DUF4389